MEWLLGQIYSNFIEDHRWRYLTNGLKVTLEVTFFAVIIGIVLGLLIAVVRSTYVKTGKLKIANFLCGIYITVIRGTPVVVQLLIIYFVDVRFCEDRQGSGGYHGLRPELRRLCG